MSSYSDLILGTTGLVSYWRLNETSGTNAEDIQGTSDGTYTGTVTLAQPGLIVGDSDTCADFAGGYATCGTIDLGTAGSTVEAWVVGDTWQPAGPNINLVAGTALNGLNASELRVTSGAIQMVGSVASSFRVAAGAALTTGTRYHLAGTVDPAVGTRVYVNGALSGSEGTTGAVAANSAFAIATYAASPNTRNFDGRIDEVAIYNVALTGQQVAAHYQAGSVRELNLLGVGA